jgi:quercetin dioxygenase-like cupin family protein
MFVYNDKIELVDVGNGLSRKVLAHNDNIMSVEVHFEKGGIGAMHSHPHEQLTYIVSGAFEFTIGEETKLVKAGDSMYKEANIEHGCVCLEAGVLVDTFTPMRKDFL